jgi:hypothetical protein
VSIVSSGKAGQGIQTLKRLLLRLMKSSGFHVFISMDKMLGKDFAAGLRYLKSLAEKQVNMRIPVQHGIMRDGDLLSYLFLLMRSWISHFE